MVALDKSFMPERPALTLEHEIALAEQEVDRRAQRPIRSRHDTEYLEQARIKLRGLLARRDQQERQR